MNLVNRAFQLQCVFRENKYMKKLLYTFPPSRHTPRAIGIPRIPLSGNVVTIPKGRVTSKVVKYFKKYKIKVYTHTVNYRGQWEKYRAMGVSGIYSDAL